MKTFLRSLFAADAAAAPARTTLGVEALDNRLMMSVTPILGNNTLTLNGDAANDTVVVSHPLRLVNMVPTFDTSRVQVTANGQTINYSANAFNRIVFNGGAGNDTFNNASLIASTIDGGLGNDTLSGGFADDVFHGSAGNDTYTGRRGMDVLHRNGHRGFFTDGDQADTTVGLVANQRMSAAELRAEGQLNVSLAGNRLTFNGPSGAGFTMTSDGWRQVTDSQGRLRAFETTQAITLNTTWGDLTLPATGAATRVQVDNTLVSGVGEFERITVGKVPVTSSGLTTTFSDKLESLTGGDVGLPNLSWGIALGDRIDADAPLSSAVPYLFARANTGYSFGYENVSVSSPNSFGGTFAFAPGDGTLYAGISGLPVVGDFGIGVSTSGNLLYTPDRIPDYVGDPDITGHFYLRGAVSLDDLGVPLGVNGEMVVDLDANNDGQLLGGALNPTTVRQKLSTVFRNMSDAEKLAAQARVALSDVAFGMNAGVDLELKAVSMKILEGSLWVKQNEVAFRGGTVDPLEGVPGAEMFSKRSLSGLDVQGFVRTTPGRPTEWGLGAAAGVGFGNSGAKIDVYAGSAINGFRVTGTVRLDLDVFGEVEAKVSGFFGFDGDWYLQGSFDFWGVTWDIKFGEENGKGFFKVW